MALTQSGPDRPQATPCSLQVVLFTYQASEVGEDIFCAAANLATRRPGVQLVVAWGGPPGPVQRRWEREVKRAQDQGADVVLVSHARPLERMRQALAMRRDWVVPVADDDPIAVNYLRSLADATARAGHGVAGVVASEHLRVCDGRSETLRPGGWMQPDAPTRLVSMLGRPGAQGTLFWAAYRHEVLAEWLDASLALPFQPSYLDQFLPHIAACHGQIAVAGEETVLMKDDRNWQDLPSMARSNARYYPDPAMSLYHEWFWAADLWRVISRHTGDPRVASAFGSWTRTMLGHMADGLSGRSRALGLTMGPEHTPVLRMLRVVGQWFNEADDATDVAAGLDEVAHMAHGLRDLWTAEGRIPTAQLDALTSAPVEAEPAMA